MNPHLGHALADRLAVTEVANRRRIQSRENSRLSFHIPQFFEPALEFRRCNEAIHFAQCIRIDTIVQRDLTGDAIRAGFEVDIGGRAVQSSCKKVLVANLVANMGASGDRWGCGRVYASATY